MRNPRTWIVKLGGSLIGSATLEHWLQAIAAQAGTRRVIIVTGGGPFADAVRAAQPALAVDDATAHEMALLAMRQFALAIAAKMPRGDGRLCTLRELQHLERATAAVWNPTDPALATATLPRNWSVTSDSLSLWLCGQFADSALLLVKSRAPAAAGLVLADLAAEDYIDDYFARLWRMSPRAVYWLQRSQWRALPNVLSRDDRAGVYAGAPTPVEAPLR